MAALWFILAALSILVFIASFSLTSTKVLKVPARIAAFVSGVAFLIFAELYGSAGQQGDQVIPGLETPSMARPAQ